MDLLFIGKKVIGNPTAIENLALETVSLSLAALYLSAVDRPTDGEDRTGKCRSLPHPDGSVCRIQTLRLSAQPAVTAVCDQKLQERRAQNRARVLY
jgi:hypothetical protein